MVVMANIKIEFFNPTFSVMPYIFFNNEFGILFLTCRDHPQGNNQLMIHPLSQPLHTLLPPFSPQPCHDMIQICTFKPLK